MVCQEGVVTELDKLFYYRNHHLSKVEGTECIGYRSLQQHELVNPPFECCEIVWWKAFIGEEVPKGCV